jgi:hypothetical protein
MVLAAATAASARSAPESSRPQIVVLDAVILQAGHAGPRGELPGHVDSATGIVRDVTGREVGRFSSTCTVLKRIGKNDALQRCTGMGATPDGRLAFDGTVRASAKTPTESISGLSGAYQRARGTITNYGVSPNETLVVIAAVPRPGVTLRVGAVARPPANAVFRTRADAACAAAARKLTKLRPFPFFDFTSRRPNAQLLTKLGRAQTGPQDARPALRALIRQLSALGKPPADPVVWAAFLARQNDVVTAYNAVDRAALAANVDAFVKAVHQGAAAERESAVEAVVFGVPSCLL